MKYIYMFNETNKYMEKYIGKKGGNLAEITNLNLSVPPGFIITTKACNDYYQNNESISDELKEQIYNYIEKLEHLTGKKFGDQDNPLMLSISCGAKTGIQGIMDTILNVGLNEEIIENLSKNNDKRWLCECYLKYIYNYSKIVNNIELKKYENQLDSIEDIKQCINKLKEEYKLKTQIDFPQDPYEQLNSVIITCLNSWNSKNANIDRKDLDISFDSGLAIYIQTMVFGNKNKDSGVGYIYSRDPITGEKVKYCEFSKESQENLKYDDPYQSIKQEFLNKFPTIYTKLENIAEMLENNYKDLVRIDFVVEDNQLFIIRAGIGKRTMRAAIKIAYDLAEENRNSEDYKLPMLQKRIKFNNN